MNTYNNNSCNGRVNIEGPNIAVKFSMIDKIPINDCTSFRDALNGNVEESLLSNAFFIIAALSSSKASLYKCVCVSVIIIGVKI